MLRRELIRGSEGIFLVQLGHVSGERTAIVLRSGVCLCRRVRRYARLPVYPRPFLAVFGSSRPQGGSVEGFEPEYHGGTVRGAVRCSAVGCELMMGQHLPPLSL